MKLQGRDLGFALEIARDITVSAVGKPDTFVPVVNPEDIAVFYKTIFNAVKETINENSGN